MEEILEWSFKMPEIEEGIMKETINLVRKGSNFIEVFARVNKL